MAVTKAIALRHLPSIPPSYEIEFRVFSAGEFNRLYLLHPVGHANGSLESFIMRVSLPVDL